MRNSLVTALAIVALLVQAQSQIDYSGGITVNAGKGDFAPHYIMAGRGGTVTQQYSTLLNAELSHTMDTTVRLSWGAGAEVWGGWSSSTDYNKVVETPPNAGATGWILPPQVAEYPAHSRQALHPARAWLQQAYVECKYRSLFLTLGQKANHSALLNDDLSSGDLTMSDNARPMPGFKAGFVNFQNIPFTGGWVQINGEVGYYRSTDKQWLEHHYAPNSHFVTTGSWLNYKNLYLRTNPNRRVVATVGMQAACQFGGKRLMCVGGYVYQIIEQQSNLKAFFKALVPGAESSVEGEQYYMGNHLGSWDVALDVNLARGHAIRAYMQKPWNDGSGIGFLNGFDGLWGIEYKAPKAGIVSGAVVEYIDLTNQSGPIHWAPADFPGTPITSEATGADDYYNNYAYNGYQAAGMSIATPFVPGIIYNTMGYMRMRDTRLRGFHVAVNGNITPWLTYRVMGSYRKSWGTPFIPRTEPASCTSAMIEATYCPPRFKGLDVKVQVALDRGTLVGDNTGTLVGITYNGNFSLGK